MYKQEQHNDYKEKGFWEKKKKDQKELQELFSKKMLEKGLVLITNSKKKKELVPIEKLKTNHYPLSNITEDNGSSKIKYNPQEGALNDGQDLLLLLNENKKNNKSRRKVLKWIYDGV